MTIETLNTIKTEVDNLNLGHTSLLEKINGAEATGVVIPADVDAALGDIAVSLNTILVWVDLAIQAIEEGTEEPTIAIMQQFLSELKAVFDKYATVIERLDPEGYGSSYGGASVFRLSATLDGVTETKDVVVAESDKLQSVDLAQTAV